MIYSLKRGTTTPTTSNLSTYELGWETTNKRLYINDNGTILRLSTKTTLNGSLNYDPSFYAPESITANRVLKSKASWTLGSDPFEYISIDGTVTSESTNLITSGAVYSALTSLQSTINSALNNKVEKSGDTMTGTLTLPAIVIDGKQIVFNEEQGTFDMQLSSNVTLQAGQEIHYYGKASVAIANRQAVQFAGVQGDHILLKPAVASEINANPNYFLGIATEAIAVGSFGHITKFGYVNDVYTSDLGVMGTVIWYDSASSTAGSLTSTKPTAPNTKIEVAAVIREATGAAENGRILVRVTVGSELGATDKNVEFTSLADKQMIAYNGANSRWENTANLVWDFANSRLGIGTSAPTHKVEISGTDQQTLGITQIGVNSTVIGSKLNDQTTYISNTTLGTYGFAAPEISIALKSNGNVGIGTTSPSAKLDIAAPDNSIMQVWSFQGEPSNYNLKLKQVVTPSNVRWVFDQVNNLTNYESVLSFNEGKVGIGTTSPDTKLHVVGDTKITGNLTVDGTTTTINTGDVYIADNIIQLNSNLIPQATPGTTDGQSSSTNTTAGIEVKRYEWSATQEEWVESFYNFMFEESSGLFKIGKTGNLQAVATRQDSPTSNGVAYWNNTDKRFDTNSTVLINPALTSSVPLTINALSGQTANLQEWKVNNVLVARIQSNGILRTPQIYNVNALDYAAIQLGDTGTIITRNIADSNPALKVNLANASATGNIAEFQKAGTTLSRVSNAGYYASAGIQNNADYDNSSVNTTANGVTIVRNKNDANPALTVNQQQGTGDILRLQFGGSTLSRFTKDGWLHIGATPGSTVNGASVAGAFLDPTTTGNAGNLYIRTTDVQGANVGGVLTFGGSYTDAMGETKFAAIKGAKDNSTSGDYGGYMTFYTRANGSAPAERMRILSNGNVGIAESTVSEIVQKLHVNGGVNINGLLRWGNGNAEINGYDTNIKFKTYNGSLAERMRITSDGKVGIGNTNPAYALDVTGDVNVTGSFRVNGTALTNVVDGTGTANTIPYWVDSNTLGSLATGTYPTLTELSYVKGLTGSAQSQISNRIFYGDVMMPTNTFGGKNLYLNHTDNAFFASDKKFVITATRHNVSDGGFTYPRLNPDYYASYTAIGSGTTRQIAETPYPSEITVFENDTLKYYTTHYTYNSSTGLITFTYTPSGTIYVYPGPTVPQYLDSPVVSTLSDTSMFFDGSYETNATVANGQYMKIKMTVDGTDYGNFATALGTYTYGEMFASYYYTGTPVTTYYRVYNYSYRPHTPGWKMIEFSDYVGTKSSSAYIAKVTDQQNHGRSIMEIIVVGHDTSGGAYTTSLSQLDYKMSRPNLSVSGSTVTKFGANKLYYQMKFGTRTADNVVIDPTGKIGLGTSTPATNMEVKSLTTGADATVRISNDGTATGNTAIQLYRNSSDYGELKLNSGGNGLVLSNYRTDNGSYITMRTAGSERFRVDYLGNVGIGTTNPIYKLDVSGNARFTDSIRSTSSMPLISKLSGNKGILLHNAGSGRFVIAPSSTVDGEDWDWTNEFSVDASSLVKGKRFQSTIATGTAPLTVASTTLVTNLNADLLDGLNSSAFLRKDIGDTAAGNHEFYATNTSGSFDTAAIEIREVNQVLNTQTSDAYAPSISWHWGGITQNKMFLASDGHLYVDGGSGTKGKLWHSSNDGSGSGLDADTLDNLHSSSFQLKDDELNAYINLGTVGLVKKTGSGSATIITDNSTNWNTAFTDTNAATNANTGSAIVRRDASGNFTASTITATLNGNASTASSVAYTGVGSVPANTFLANNTAGVNTAQAISGASALALMGVTSTAAELNALDGITATVTELNYTDGVTSNIQTQLDGKANAIVSYRNTPQTATTTSPISYHTTGTLLANSYYQIQVDGMWSKTATTNASAPVITFTSSNTDGSPTWNGTFLWADTSAATAYKIENNSVGLSLSNTAVGFQPTNSPLANTSSYWGMNGLIYTGTTNKTLTFYVYASIAAGTSGNVSLDKISVVATKVG